jgi:type IV pilus assembly protein PilW
MRAAIAFQPRRGECGTTIVEVMIALTLGLILMAGLVGVFVNASRASTEFHRNAEQIENGRYAMDVLLNDLHHAGYYGSFYRLASPGAFPDPCALSDAAGGITSGMPFAVQGFDAPSFAGRPNLAATSCAPWLSNTNLIVGSDVLVIRRASTATLVAGDIATNAEVFLQSTPVEAQIQIGTGAAMTTHTKADGTPATLFMRDGITAAEIRKYAVHVYFVAPCSMPADGGVLCTGAADDSGKPIPTLKRLELGAVGGLTTFSVESIAEGIESLQVDYGIDDSPSVVDSMTNLKGDGVPDRYSAAPLAAEYADTATLNVHVLARNTEASVGYTDSKTYSLGLSGVKGPMTDHYRRHAYAGLVRLTNMSSRREIPR